MHVFTQSELDAIEARIIAACEKVTAAGVSICSGDYGVMLGEDEFAVAGTDGAVCPLGALLVAEQIEGAFDEGDAVERTLGVDADFVSSFTGAVDGDVHDPSIDTDAWAMGRRIIARYEPAEDNA
jgi:hypothetical protein